MDAPARRALRTRIAADPHHPHAVEQILHRLLVRKRPVRGDADDAPVRSVPELVGRQPREVRARERRLFAGLRVYGAHLGEIESAFLVGIERHRERGLRAASQRHWFFALGDDRAVEVADNPCHLEVAQRVRGVEQPRGERERFAPLEDIACLGRRERDRRRPSGGRERQRLAAARFRRRRDQELRLVFAGPVLDLDKGHVHLPGSLPALVRLQVRRIDVRDAAERVRVVDDAPERLLPRDAAVRVAHPVAAFFVAAAARRACRIAPLDHAPAGPDLVVGRHPENLHGHVDPPVPPDELGHNLGSGQLGREVRRRGVLNPEAAVDLLDGGGREEMQLFCEGVPDAAESDQRRTVCVDNLHLSFSD